MACNFLSSLSFFNIGLTEAILAESESENELLDEFLLAKVPNFVGCLPVLLFTMLI